VTLYGRDKKVCRQERHAVNGTRVPDNVNGPHKGGPLGREELVDAELSRQLTLGRDGYHAAPPLSVVPVQVVASHLTACTNGVTTPARAMNTTPRTDRPRSDPRSLRSGFPHPA
jgi:hypothetical protein